MDNELEKRIYNLEITLQACMVVLRETQPPSIQNDLNKIMAKHYNVSQLYGAFDSEKTK